MKTLHKRYWKCCCFRKKSTTLTANTRINFSAMGYRIHFSRLSSRKSSLRCNKYVSSWSNYYLPIYFSEWKKEAQKRCGHQPTKPKQTQTFFHFCGKRFTEVAMWNGWVHKIDRERFESSYMCFDYFPVLIYKFFDIFLWLPLSILFVCIWGIVHSCFLIQNGGPWGRRWSLQIFIPPGKFGDISVWSKHSVNNSSLLKYNL